MTTDCGTYLRLWDDTGDVWTLVDTDFNQIDHAVSEYLSTSRDSLLHLTTLSGETFVTRASRVECWVVSTPETRYRELEFLKAAEIEKATACEALGIVLSDDTDEEDEL